ncbi:MAG: hypothetical protein COA58_02330 [Bacteroidetes bacterium]|nr:MAG: hypothetical protein COA58_02330 [Bacteroidota bacterium]
MKLTKALLIIALCSTVININAGSSYNNVVDFYGHRLNISYDQQLAALRFYKLDQKEITHKLDYYRNNNLVTSSAILAKHIDHYNLDGAATTILIDKYASRITRSKSSNQKIFVKYLMLKELGYDVILTKTGSRLNCMGNLAFTPGRYIFIKYAGKNYKDLNFKNRKNHGQHLIFRDKKVTRRNIRRNIRSVPKINAHQKSREVSFNFGVEKHNFTAASNASVTEFLADLPLFEVGREFTDLQVSREMDESVVDYLRGQVEDRDIVDQVRFILAFVQQVVPYGSDYDKYGEERFYYPEETIMAATADCEDKAMLMAYLTKEILKLNTVALYFKKDEHLSLGIEIPDYKPTGSFGYMGKTYVSCEPTAKYPRLTQTQFDLRRIDEVIEL